METHEFTLPSGVKASVRPMTGKHQRLLSEQGNQNMFTGLNSVLLDLLVSLGSKSGTEITSKVIDQLLAADRAKILVEARQFSLGFPTEFRFKYEYVASDGSKASQDTFIDISRGFPTKPYKFQVSDYASIVRTNTLTLPISKKEVKWDLLDGTGEMAATKLDRKKISSHTPIQLRNPRTTYQGDNEAVDISLDLDTLALADIEALRGHIEETEGEVNTEALIIHPEADRKPMNEREVRINLVGEKTFFFPSGAL